MELNIILLNSMPNEWISKAYMHGFYCESITLKICKCFERMEIVESIYEGVVQTSNKKFTRSDTNRAVHNRKTREESASSKTYSETSKSAGKSWQAHKNVC